MNTFQAIFMIFATMSASCLGQYTSQSGTQGIESQQAPASPQVADLTGMNGQSSMQFASPIQESLYTPAAGTGSCAASASSATTTKICSCITVNAGQPSAGNDQAASPVTPSFPTVDSSTDFVAPADAQSFDSPSGGSSAPVAQSNYAASTTSSGAQQTYSSQSFPAQAGDNRGSAKASYAAAAPVKNNESY